MSEKISRLGIALVGVYAFYAVPIIVSLLKTGPLWGVESILLLFPLGLFVVRFVHSTNALVQISFVFAALHALSLYLIGISIEALEKYWRGRNQPH